MKIAVLVREFPALSETFVLNQITGLIDQGHEVDIYASPPEKLSKVHPDVEKYDLYKRTFYYERVSRNYLLRFIKSLYLFAIWGTRYPKQMLQVFNLKRYGAYAKSLRFSHEIVPFLRNGLPKYDIIHCHFGPNGVKGMHLRNLGVIKGKLSTVFHGFDVSGHLDREGTNAYDRLFQEGDLFLPISERWKKRILELGAPADKTIVHHMGIDCQEFTFKPRELSPGETVQITTVCRLVEKKGVEYGIRAVAALKQYFPNIRYTIVGDGSLKKSLEDLIAELQAGDVINLLGWRQKTEVIEILEKSHLFLAPSITASNGDQEGIPVALMEAMAMGIPVVSTFHSGIPELIENGISGSLVPERDVNALTKAISELIQNPEQIKPISYAARQKIENEFNIHTLNSRLIKIFKQPLQASSSNLSISHVS